MRRRRIVTGGMHTTGNFQAVFFAAAGNEGVGVRRRDAGLLRLLALLSWTNSCGRRFCEAIPWLTLRNARRSTE